MVKRFFMLVLTATILTLSLPLRVRADAIAEPSIVSDRNFGIIVLVIGLIIIVAVVTVLLVRFLKNRSGRK